MQSQTATSKFSRPAVARGLFPVVFGAGPQIVATTTPATVAADLTTNWTQTTYSSGTVAFTLAAGYDGMEKTFTAGVSTGALTIIAAGSAPLYNAAGTLVATSINVATLSEVTLIAINNVWRVKKTSLAGVTYT